MGRSKNRIISVSENHNWEGQGTKLVSDVAKLQDTCGGPRQIVYVVNRAAHINKAQNKMETFHLNYPAAFSKL
jgi:hypothetical protein